MKNSTKETLNKMLSLIDDFKEEPNFFGKKTYLKLSESQRFALIRDLLNWSNDLFLELFNLNAEKMQFEEKNNEHFYKDNISLLINDSAYLKEIYEIQTDGVTFNNSLSQKEISEIRKYVKDNKKINIQSKETRMK